MKSIYIYINGILNFPGRSSNWTGRAVTHTILEIKTPAEKVEYLSFATFHRLLGQRNRVKKLARTLSFYQMGWDINLVAHSNGAAVVLGALHYLDWPEINTIHFFSPACPADFNKTGLRAAQDAGKIKQVNVYVGGRDLPLRIADNPVGRFFGYGALGRRGPVNHVPERTQVIRRDDWGHSDWWTDSNFPWTMTQITKKTE